MAAPCDFGSHGPAANLGRGGCVSEGPVLKAFETVVDRLLASPRYGERMAWDWLEAARYADSNGYQGDVNVYVAMA